MSSLVLLQCSSCTSCEKPYFVHQLRKNTFYTRNKKSQMKYNTEVINSERVQAAAEFYKFCYFQLINRLIVQKQPFIGQKITQLVGIQIILLHLTSDQSKKKKNAEFLEKLLLLVRKCYKNQENKHSSRYCWVQSSFSRRINDNIR